MRHACCSDRVAGRQAAPTRTGAPAQRSGHRALTQAGQDHAWAGMHGHGPLPSLVLIAPSPWDPPRAPGPLGLPTLPMDGPPTSDPSSLSTPLPQARSLSAGVSTTPAVGKKDGGFTALRAADGASAGSNTAPLFPFPASAMVKGRERERQTHVLLPKGYSLLVLPQTHFASGSTAGVVVPWPTTPPKW